MKRREEVCYVPTRNIQETATLVQRLFRLQAAAALLQERSSACIRRLVVLQSPLDREDVAGVTDRLHEVFHSFSFLTRSNGWHDAE